MKIDCHSKVNLGLRVLYQRSDGYHELETVFQELAWGDQLELVPAIEFSFTTSGIAVPSGSDNLCVKAYELFRKHRSETPPVQIHLHKVVPPGSGLGGGSADAAAVLKALNRLTNGPLSERELINLAAELGSDVPFFIRGGTQWAWGRGEKLMSIQLDFTGWFLLVIPPIHISTRWAYQALNSRLTGRRSPVTFRGLLKKADLVRFFENDFESVVIPAYPEIGAIKETLIEEGAFFAGLSGSGATMYGIFSERDQAETAARVFRKNSYHTELTAPIFTTTSGIV